MKPLLTVALSLSFAIFVFSCSPQQDSSSLKTYFKPDSSQVQSGGIAMIPIQTAKGTFHVWTKRFGNNPKIKVLLLHGGPGATHEYFECMEGFLPQEEIEFIYYDQLGSAYSDQPKDTALWTIDRFVDELEQVRQALGLNKDNFYLLGHSWGGVLAMEYALKYQQNIKGLIISNMMSSASEYVAYSENVLAKQMNPAAVKEIKAIEAKGDFKNPRYMELLVPNFYMEHICRLKEWPDPVNRAFARMNEQIYVLMQGPSEFGLSGRLEKWERKGDLKNITVPTLVVGSKYDTMDPEHMKVMSTLVQNGSYLYCPNGSHMAMWDDQQVYMSGLVKFLKGVNEGKKMAAY